MRLELSSTTDSRISDRNGRSVHPSFMQIGIRCFPGRDTEKGEVNVSCNYGCRCFGRNNHAFCNIHIGRCIRPPGWRPRRARRTCWFLSWRRRRLSWRRPPWRAGRLSWRAGRLPWRGGRTPRGCTWRRLPCRWPVSRRRLVWHRPALVGRPVVLLWGRPVLALEPDRLRLDLRLSPGRPEDYAILLIAPERRATQKRSAADGTGQAKLGMSRCPGGDAA